MRKIIHNLVAAGVLGFLCVGGGSCQPHGRAFSEKGLLQASAEQLAGTDVQAHREVAIRPGRNVLWCGSFQLAWNAACELVGGELRFGGKQPEMVTLLNRKEMTAGDVDAGSYVAVAGFVRDDVYKRIDAALREKFAGHASPTLLPDPKLTPRPQDMVVYSYLFKNLEFAVPYEKGDGPLQFDGKTPVAWFGMGRNYKPGRGRMAEQTLILDYAGPEDFVVELKSKSVRDRLILARVRPGQTLAETMAAVQKRVAAAKPQPADAADVLMVPKMNFDITRKYRELTGRQVAATKAGMAEDLVVLAADQKTRFQMDEKGVRLKSESRMQMGCSAEAHPRPGHEMIFDGPFLVMLQEREAREAYFGLWVGNGELLVKRE
ncbi:MAG TPA: hypothetical protein VIL86_09365 [Tepidisphaeraceae bacterium]